MGTSVFAPLDGLRVVDLSQNLAGPYATQILGDLGADVIKVEPPSGDTARQWGPPFAAGESPMYLCANRNKRSVVLDLKTERGREALTKLAAQADVFVQAFRAGVAERLGFDEPALRTLNPSVIYATLSAYGDQGPLAGQPAYDVLLQAHAGLMSVTGNPGRSPARVGTSVVDFGTATWLALAILAALRERDRTGQGAYVTTSLLETAVALMAYQIQGYQVDGTVPGPFGSGLHMIAPYQAFACTDGSIMIGAATDAAFRRLCVALELPEAAADPRFASNAERVRHRDEIAALVAQRTAQEPAQALLTRLRSAGVPCAPINDVADVAADAQVAASGLLRSDAIERTGRRVGGNDRAGRRAAETDRFDPPDAGPNSPGHGVSDVAAPPRWNGVHAPLRRPPPRLGEHTHEILRELGLEP